MTENHAELRYPTQIIFSLIAEADQEIGEVWLLLGTSQKNCAPRIIRRRVSDFKAAQSVDVRWIFDFYQENLLPPGGELWWQWELKAQNGASTLYTEKQSITLQDQRYNWKKINNGTVDLWWVEGDYTFGADLSALAYQALSEVNLRTGMSLPAQVRMIVYPNIEQMQDALPYLPDWSAAVAMPEYGLIIAGLAPGETGWAHQIITHEMAHLLSSGLTFNCLGAQIPTWLSEGISVSAEPEIHLQAEQEVLNALKHNALPALRTLTGSFASNQRQADLAYTQSGMTVRYLLETYGQADFQDFLTRIAAGKMVDTALNEVYGLTTDSLDNSWRSSLGFSNSAALAQVAALTLPTLPPTVLPPPTPATPQPTAQPTVISMLPTPAAPVPAATTGREELPPALAGGILLAVIGGVFWAMRHRREAQP